MDVRRIALSLAALMFAGAAAAQPCEDPKVLRFSIIPTQESVRELNFIKPNLSPSSRLSPVLLQQTMRRATIPAICVQTTVIFSPSIQSEFRSLIRLA